MLSDAVLPSSGVPQRERGGGILKWRQKRKGGGKKAYRGRGRRGGVETDADSGTFCGMWVDWEKLGLAEWRRRRRRRRSAIPSLLSTPADGCRIIEPPTLIRGIEEGEGERGKTGPFVR